MPPVSLFLLPPPVPSVIIAFQEVRGDGALLSQQEAQEVQEVVGRDQGAAEVLQEVLRSSSWVGDRRLEGLLERLLPRWEEIKPLNMNHV